MRQGLHRRGQDSYYQGPQLRRRTSARTAAFTFLFAAFAAGGLFFGYVFVATLADLLAVEPPRISSSPTPGGSAPRSAPVAVAAGLTPVAGSPPTPSPTALPVDLPAWRGTDRVTILLLGLDMRDDERDQPTRSDTMILLSVDPVRKRAGMLSIPRDLWVPIPGYGDNKINTAHFLGEAEKPGSGPDLARKTVEYNFGVKVNYYARVDFRGFQEMLDAIGGVDLDVLKPVKDDGYPTEDYGIRRIYIPTGLQHLDGAAALRYARSRHSDTDFGRNQRQQAVLLAARGQALRPSVLPKLPQMISILLGALKTDVPVTDILPLYSMARGIQPQDIVSRTIDHSMTIDVKGDGTVLVPKRGEIRSAIDEIFGGGATPVARTRTPTPSSTPEPTRTPTPVRTPTATPTRGVPVEVRVLNGTLRTGLAARTADTLRSHGYVVRDVGQAKRSDYARSQILDHTRRPRAAVGVADLLGISEGAVEPAPPADDGADVTVILGLDAPEQ